MANLNIPSTRDRTLDAFKGKMVGGGARPNLFECELFFPNDAIPTDGGTFKRISASLFVNAITSALVFPNVNTGSEETEKWFP